MASSKKRSATRELNHENWDKEDEETEDRGVFETASKNVLSGRVIKKAKRRGGAGNEGTGGTFAGFSGFKSISESNQETTVSAAKNPFGFLSSSASQAGSTPALKEGPAKDRKESKESQESNQSNQSKPLPPLNELFKPKAGSWKCSVCDISNDASKEACAACSTAKPATKSGGPPSGSKWSCDSCLVPNQAEDEACVCCTTGKPSPKTAPALTAGPKWTCDACMVPNKAEDEACVCCTTPKPGVKTSKNTNGGTSKGFSFGAPSNGSNSPASGFKFGSTTSSDTKPSTGFKFGSTSSEAEPSSSSTGFKFGSSSIATSSPSVEKPTGFSFGSTSSVDKPSGFAFGSSTTNATALTKTQTPGFKFTASTTASPVSPFTFKLSSTPSTPSLPKVTAALCSEKKALKEEEGNNNNNVDARDKYAANLRALNRQLTKWIKSKVDDNPNVILSPIFKDYEKHLAAIAEKYPLSTTEAPKKEASPPSLLGAVFGNKEGKSDKVSFSTGSSGKSGFGSFSSPLTADNSASQKEDTKSEEKIDGSSKKESAATPAPTNLFSFGSTAPKSSGFSFGSTASTTSTTTPGGLTGSTGFSFGTSSSSTFGSVGSSSFFTGASSTAAASSQKKENTSEEAAEDEPPKVEVKTVEENDAKFSMRCKLYYKKEKDFVDRGVGMVHLKLLDDNKKVQLLVRAETNLGNILLNIMLNDKINFAQRGNNLQFVAVPNPVIKGIPEGPISMLLKVKSAQMAEELHGKIQEILKEGSS